MIFLVSLLGLRFAYGLLALVVPFYMLFSRWSYLEIYRYLRQRQGYSRWRAFTGTYRNHFVFGQVILDRFAVFAGRGDLFRVEIKGEEHFRRLQEGEKGFVIAGAHVGNFEIAGYLLHARRKRVNVLVYPGETRMVLQKKTEAMGNNDARVIPVLEDMSHLFTAYTALRDGEIVSMACDRNLGSMKSVTCDFLGGKADFPAGAFALATRLEVEMISVFVMKEGTKRYVAHVKPVARANGLSRDEEIAACARSFAGELEQITRQYPEQWFNYYAFWKDERDEIIP
jgi:predicted LPLAT superfamily acyltransferase